MTQHNPFDPEQTREDVRREKLVADAEQASDIQWLMGSERGRRLMWSWLEFTGVYRSSFVAADPSQTGFNEGVRNVGLMLISSVMRYTPEEFVAMQREAEAAAEERKTREQDTRRWPLSLLPRRGA